MGFTQIADLMSMKEQPHWTNILTTTFFEEYYIKQRMSYPQLMDILQKDKHVISIGTIHKYAKRLGFGRNASQAARNKQEDPLDCAVSFLDTATLEAIDGFLLGDGCIAMMQSDQSYLARIQCGVEYQEFCGYLMSFFHRYRAVVKDYKDANMKSGIKWCGRSLSHPDLYWQYLRWYKEGVKQVPNDVRITPLSVMMWYLGDGSVVQKDDTVTLRLSTDGFLPERVEFLASKLQEIGIACHRNGDNRIMVEARGIPAFFNFIGRLSPVACYAYKFDLPTWRFEAKRMKDVAGEVGIPYNRLSYLVKIGRIPCHRTSPKSKPRFLPEHIAILRSLPEISGLTSMK